MFEKATRMKLRFTTNSGNLTTEDLWDLNLNQLNDLAKSLRREIKSEEEEDFLTEKSEKDTLSKMKFDIVLHILNIKLADKKSSQEATVKKAERERILAAIKEQEDKELKTLSKEELLARLESL